jgi:hypothetical protein
LFLFHFLNTLTFRGNYRERSALVGKISERANNYER